TTTSNGGLPPNLSLTPAAYPRTPCRQAHARPRSPRLSGMRAVLVVNPNATTTTSRTRDVLYRALASETKLEVAETRYRGHAAALAQRCIDEEIDVIVVLGGDGTVNEIVNGLL